MLEIMEAQAVCEMNQELVQDDPVSCPPSLQNAQLQSVVKMATNMKGKSLDTTGSALAKVVDQLLACKHGGRKMALNDSGHVCCRIPFVDSYLCDENL